LGLIQNGLSYSGMMLLDETGKAYFLRPTEEDYEKWVSDLVPVPTKVSHLYAKKEYYYLVDEHGDVWNYLPNERTVEQLEFRDVKQIWINVYPPKSTIFLDTNGFVWKKDEEGNLTNLGFSNICKFAAVNSNSMFHVIALDNDGLVWALGNNNYGQLGLGTGLVTSESPEKIPGLENISDIHAGDSYSCALTSSGKLYFFGLLNYVRNALYYDGQEIFGFVTTPTIIPEYADIAFSTFGTDDNCLSLFDSEGTLWVIGNVWNSFKPSYIGTWQVQSMARCETPRGYAKRQQTKSARSCIIQQ
jgi:alpha-tubulin suppressor-like RCC1 family protein